VPPFARPLIVMLTLLGSTASASGEPLAAYMYTVSGAAGVPALASMKPAAIGTVFLKAVDVDAAGSVYPKLDGSGRFYPAAWPGSSRPPCAALVNADPTIDWTTTDPTAALTAALTGHNWQQDFLGGITVDAEFTANIQSFPQHWQACMHSLRGLANGQGRAFSLYLSPKYLSAARYPSTASANAAAIASILGTPPTGVVNSVLFPVYAGDGSNVDQATLQAASAAAAGGGFAYGWILDIAQSTTTFAAGLQTAHAAGPSPAGYVAYSYVENQAVTADMNTNLQAIVDLASVPEPGAALPAVAAVALGLAAWNRRRRR